MRGLLGEPVMVGGQTLVWPQASFSTLSPPTRVSEILHGYTKYSLRVKLLSTRFWLPC